MTEYRAYSVKYVEGLEAEIQHLTELTTNDGIEIGSYREGTGLRGECKAMEAEIDRLSAALEVIASHRYPLDSQQYFDMRYEAGREAAAGIARAALKGEE